MRYLVAIAMGGFRQAIYRIAGEFDVEEAAQLIFPNQLTLLVVVDMVTEGEIVGGGMPAPGVALGASERNAFLCGGQWGWSVFIFGATT